MNDDRARRVTDLTSTGVGFAYMFGSVAVVATGGALIGLPSKHPGPGATIGFIVGFGAWIVILIAAHRQLRPYRGEHREPDQDP